MTELKRSHKGSAPTRHCEAPGCKAATTGRKPYCSAHVLLNPYAARIVSTLKEGA